MICIECSSVDDESRICSDFLFLSDTGGVETVVVVVDIVVEEQEGDVWSVVKLLLVVLVVEFVVLLLFDDVWSKRGVNSEGITRSSGGVKEASSFLRSFVWRIRDARCWLIDELTRFSAVDVSCNSRIHFSHWSIISPRQIENYR